MAKRTPRSQANDSAALEAPAQAPARPKLVGKSGRAVVSADPIGPTVRNEPTGVAVSEDEIRHRAYLRYLERGGNDGGDFDDWLQAERELKNK